MNIALNALTACALVTSATAGFAQDASGPAPAPLVAVAKAAPAGDQATLPANSEIMLSMNEELTTKGGKLDEGHMFRMSVAQDVMLGDYVVIPKGTPGFGEVTWKTGKGAFGKSGKMEIELRYVELAGRRVPVSGKYRQEGEGNTVATVAGVVLAGVFAGFVTGKSARIPQGRELKAFTTEALPVIVPAGAKPAAAALQATAVSASQN